MNYNVTYEEVETPPQVFKNLTHRGSRDVKSFKINFGNKVKCYVIKSSDLDEFGKLEGHFSVLLTDNNIPVNKNRHPNTIELGYILSIIGWPYKIISAGPMRNGICYYKSLNENKMNNAEDTVTVYEIKEILNEQLDQHIEHLKSLFKKGSNHFSEAENFAKRTIEPILIQLNDINLLANTVIVRRKLNETSK